MKTQRIVCHHDSVKGIGFHKPAYIGGTSVSSTENAFHTSFALLLLKKFDMAACSPYVFSDQLPVVYAGDAKQLHTLFLEFPARRLKEPLNVRPVAVSLVAYNDVLSAFRHRLSYQVVCAFIVRRGVDKIHSERKSMFQSVYGPLFRNESELRSSETNHGNQQASSS